MKIFKKCTMFFLACLFSFVSFYPMSAYAEETGWVEISVSVPEYFTDQIYIQLQATDNIDANSEENYVQINRHNDYVGRIQLPVGTYEITDKYVYENPDLYNIELSDETSLPITVTSESTATSVKLNCTVVPTEQLPDSKDEYADWILEEAQESSDSASAESADTVENEATDTDNNIEEEDKGPFRRILASFMRTLFWGGIIGLISYFVYKKYLGT